MQVSYLRVRFIWVRSMACNILVHYFVNLFDVAFENYLLIVLRSNPMILKIHC